MEEQPICPHCGRILDEAIPLALEGSIQLKCPFCEMTYSFQRYEDTSSIEEEVGYYLSPGSFRRKMVLGDRDKPREADSRTMQVSCLVLCLLGPLIIFGIYWLIINIFWIIVQS